MNNFTKMLAWMNLAIKVRYLHPFSEYIWAEAEHDKS